MKRKSIWLLGIATITLLSCSATPVSAAKYTKSEAKQVRRFQRNYRDLNKVKYTKNNIYLTRPNFAVPFSPGVLDPGYIPASMAYINYYRSLVGLPKEENYDQDNKNAQLGAAALAAVNADENLRVHGLLNYLRPNYFSESQWNAAEIATLGNVNFLESQNGATAGEIVTDLVRDDNNIAGRGNVGHRNLILSTRATRMGIGAAYGEGNGILYSVENGVFADDILRTPVKNEVLYPAKKVFPYELVGSRTPWSYSTTKSISSKPKIYITDLSKKKKKRYKATQVQNWGRSFYGDGYTTTITYQPGKIKLVNTHKYRVKIGKHRTYTFRFFRQASKLK